VLKAVGKERQHTQHIPNTALSLSHTHKRTHTTHSLYLYLVLVGATYCVLYRESVLYMECVQRVEQARTHKHECAPHPRAPEITQNCGNREYVGHLVDRYMSTEFVQTRWMLANTNGAASSSGMSCGWAGEKVAEPCPMERLARARDLQCAPATRAQRL
jgi:hypothetical protein